MEFRLLWHKHKFKAIERTNSPKMSNMWIWRRGHKSYSEVSTYWVATNLEKICQNAKQLAATTINSPRYPKYYKIKNLTAWRENRSPIHYDGPLIGLQQAVENQNKLGWSPFIKGFIHVDWKELQRRHLQQLHLQKSHRWWLKMLTIKLWQISWDMWRFRNGVVHSQSTTSTTNFTFLLTTEILKELEHGYRLLPPSSRYLFHSTQEKLLNSTVNNKKLWLANVWAARDAYTPADTITQTRNTIVQAYIVAWKKRL